MAHVFSSHPSLASTIPDRSNGSAVRDWGKRNRGGSKAKARCVIKVTSMGNWGLIPLGTFWGMNRVFLWFIYWGKMGRSIHPPAPILYWLRVSPLRMVIPNTHSSVLGLCAGQDPACAHAVKGKQSYHFFLSILCFLNHLFSYAPRKQVIMGLCFPY